MCPIPSTEAAATSLLRCHVKSARGRAGRSGVQRRGDPAGAGVIPGLQRHPPTGGRYAVRRLPRGVRPAGSRCRTSSCTPTAAARRSHRRADVNADPRRHRPTARASRRPTAVARPRTGSARSYALPLGRLAYARSGDKGGDANVGVWIPADHPEADAAYEWLARVPRRGDRPRAAARGRRARSSRSTRCPTCAPSTS